MRHTRHLILAAAAALGLLVPTSAGADPRSTEPVVVRLAEGLDGGSGSVIGPDGALYVTETAAGRISRVDLATGEVTTFAEGLPPAVVGLGGVMDVAFLGGTAYALVTLVGSDVGGGDVVGLYRIDGPDSFTVVADIGAYSVANPPETDFDVPSGVQYAMEAFRGGFLVTDGHLNRVLHVTPDGAITEVLALGNVVPTGLETRGRTVYLGLAGPVPHLPEDGVVVAFRAGRTQVRQIAAGAPLLVDVERGRGGTLYALAQGEFPSDGEAGAPATPDTGSLMRADRDGDLVSVVEGLDRPTSLEIVGSTAYVVTLDGEVWMIEGLTPRRNGRGS